VSALPWYEIAGTWAAALLTVCILSYLYKDNPFYRFAEHLFVGVGAGYGVVIQFWDTLMPNVFVPIGQGLGMAAIAKLPDGSPGNAPAWWGLEIVPILLAVLMFARFNAKLAWLARIPVAMIVGVFAGVAIPAQASANLLNQIQGNILPLWGVDLRTTLINLILVIGLPCTLLYFFFSKPHEGALGKVARGGVWFMMLSFGASFGFTVTGRIALAIARADELINYDPVRSPHAPWSGIVSVAFVTLGLVGWELWNRSRAPAETAPPAS
jgi:hypothetical protein